MSDQIQSEISSSAKKKSRRSLIVGLVVMVLIAAGIASYYMFFYESRNYTDGIKAIKARLYDDAVDRFKICLVENENDKKAKGMLLISLGLQNKVPRDQLLDLFDRFLALYVNSRLNYTFSSRDYWNDFRNYNDTQKHAIREVLKNIGIRTESWNEVEEIVESAAEQTFYRLSPYSDDLRPYVLMSSIFLSMKGDRNAEKYLISAAIESGTDVKYLTYPGLAMVDPLKDELKNRESLLYTDGMKVLREISLYSMLISSIKDLHGARRFYERDFPLPDDYKSTCSYLFEQRQLWKNFNPQLSCFLNSNVDPLLGNLKQIDSPVGHFAKIVVYDDETSNFVTQFFIWDKLNWKLLKVNTNGVSYNNLRSKEFPILIGTDSTGALMYVGYGSYIVKPKVEVREVSKGFVFDPSRGWRQQVQLDTVIVGSTEEYQIKRWDVYDINSLDHEIRFVSNSNDYRDKIRSRLFSLASRARKAKTDLQLVIGPSDSASTEASFHLASQEPKDLNNFTLSKSDSLKGASIYIVAVARCPGQDAVHPITMYCVRKSSPDTTYVKELN